MQISEKQIQLFQNLYQKHFGQDISKEEAIEKATKLCRLLEIIYKPSKTNHAN